MNWKKDWWRVLMHVPVGWALCYCAWINTGIGICFMLGWLVYELNEDRHLKDRAYVDVHGLLIGLVIGCAVWGMLK